MNIYKILNWIKRIIKFIPALIIAIIIIPICFFSTNWENKEDRKYAKHFFKNLFK